MNLLVFLSDRCNLACDYCFLSLNRGPAAVLDREAGRGAIWEHYVRSGPEATVTFLGGEPFVHFELLDALASHARALSLRAKLNVFTNGALACPEKLARLRELGVSVTFSLDGAAAANDGHRRLVGRPGESALAQALLAAEGADRSALRANMVVCEDTVGSLLAGIESLRREGFKTISFHLNLRQAWSAEGLRALKTALDGVSRYWRTLSREAPGSLEFSHLESYAGTAFKHDYDDVVLGADGRYYPCDAFFARPYAELSKWAVGDAKAGVDWARREAHHAEAKAFIHARMERDFHYTCPREAYYLALASGGDPDAAVRSFHRADNIFGDALRALAAAELRPA